MADWASNDPPLIVTPESRHRLTREEEASYQRLLPSSSHPLPWSNGRVPSTAPYEEPTVSEIQLDEIHETLKTTAAHLGVVAQCLQGLLVAATQHGGVPPTFTVAPVPPLPVKIHFALPDARLPTKAHEGDGAYDLYPAEDVVVTPGGDQKIDTGLILEIPVGWYARVHARSGSYFHIREGIIDAGYRNTVKVWVFNRKAYPMTFGPELGARNNAVAQLTFHRRTDVVWKMVANAADLSPSDRGSGGFGSTNR